MNYVRQKDYLYPSQKTRNNVPRDKENPATIRGDDRIFQLKFHGF